MAEDSTPKSPLPANGRRNMAKSVALIAIAIIVIAGMYSIFGLARIGRRTELPPREECLRLEHVKNVALAYLENEEFAEADQRFAELAAKLPSEPLGARDLAICRMLWQEFGGKSKPDPKDVQSAVETLAAREPNSFLAHLLIARWELRQDPTASPAESDARLARAVAAYQKASELAPENAAPRYELYEHAKDSADSALVKQGQLALGEAYRLAPNNLWVLRDWLLTQAQTKNPQILEVLSAAKERLRPVRELILRRMGHDLWESLDQTTAAVEKGNWGEALGHCRVAGNVVVSDDVLKSDRRRLVPHLLELADYQFSPSFQKHVASPSKLPTSTHPPPFRRVVVRNTPLATLSGAQALALADFDLNGTPDILVLREGELVVLGRSEPTEPWSVITRADIPPGFSRMLVADLDEDENRDVIDKRLPGELKIPAGLTLSGDNASIADVDVVLYGASGVMILRNERDGKSGARTLVPVELSEPLQAIKQVTAAVLIDFYHDGDLDLVVATEHGVSLWTNQGNLTFGDLSKFSTLPPVDVVLTSLVAVDWDRDADLDIVASGPGAGTLGWLENLRHGQFRWRKFESDYGDLDQSRSLALLEADGNASWDLAGVGEMGVNVALTATISPGVVRHIRTEQASPGPRRGVVAWDYDNDARQDLLVWRQDSFTALHGIEEGEFEASSNMFSPETKDALDCVVGDLDGDGDLDLVVATSDQIAIYDNQLSNSNHWLRLQLRGGKDPQGLSNGRVNHNAVGSLVEVRTEDRYQAQVATGQTMHFGLGPAAEAEVARVVWTNGLPQSVVAPKGDQLLQEVLILKGSCPYLYTWTGERYEFYTDLLWAAPLGLQFGEGNLAPWREWEYLKVSGDRLVPKDGRYCLQITEELWEAAYFDQVELIAVDHPADVEVYSNDKVGPPEIAEFRMHSVRSPKTPVAARDKHGRDVLDEVKSRDGVFFRGFDAKIMQGLTDEHYLELDLGKLDKPRQLMLFLTGWIHPTDTSLNVAIGENKSLNLPRPPRILVPDKEGQWQEARPYMGFPGGKTKTIAVDLAGLFPAEDYRMRIVTTAEIYWDEAFFTVDEEPSPTKITPLKLLSADLHYRGYSAAYPKRLNVPDSYDYSQVSVEPRWPPMGGKFTRYGDVRELLTATDDLHVVFGSGDEFTMEFEAPPDPPAGWKRDFIIHNVGWDKDADLNTVYGQTVDPLPFVTMKSYPFPPGESYPDTPRHRKYVETYQTREQTPAHFWKLLRPVL